VPNLLELAMASRISSQAVEATYLSPDVPALLQLKDQPELSCIDLSDV
jgi:hypothetical protein